MSPVPPWLESLLSTAFFSACRTHWDSARSECNMYCLDCKGDSFCFYCRSSKHKDHQVIQPWRLLQSSESFVYTWLVGYSALMGPIGGILLADYYLIRRTKLNVSDLYTLCPTGEYFYTGGYNLAAIGALIVGILPVVPGFLQKVGIVQETNGIFVGIYNNAWFFSFFLAGFLYWIVSSLVGDRRRSGDGSDPLLAVEN